MYEKESLKITEQGFCFTIKNSIANGNVIEVYLLALNEEVIPFPDIKVKNEAQEMSADNISNETPVELRKGVATIFTVKKDQLSELIDKEVKIKMKFKVQVRESKMTIEFDFQDILRR